MAAMLKFLFVFTCLLSNLLTTYAQFVSYTDTIPLVTVEDCAQVGNQTKQFFDTTKMACVPCSQDNTFQDASADGYTCVCNSGYRYVTNGGGSQVTCAKCGNNEVASSTGYNCVTCPNGKDPATQTCAACTATSEISPERDLLGNMYTSPTPRSCQNCSAGSVPNSDNDRCVKCTTTYPITNNNTCACPPNFQVIGEFCFPDADFDGVTVSQDNKYVIPDTVASVSKYLQDNLLRAYAQCFIYKNSTACQTLANMCVLTFYEYTIQHLPDGPLETACELYLKPAREENNWAPEFAPWLYYMSLGLEQIDGDDVLFGVVLDTVYTFDPAAKLDYRVARYDLDGNYLGLSNVENGRIQLCADTSNKQNAAFVFGTYYKQTCTINAKEFWNQNKYPLEFMDPYIEVVKDGVKELYPIPVNILNYRSVVDGYDEINRGADADKYFFRRFFMVDNVGNIPNTGGEAEMVRYAKSITINVELQAENTQGFIFPPALDIEYGKVSLADANDGATADITFTVDYTYDPLNYKRNFRISIGVLSTLGVIYAGYKTWCWSKRSGRPSLDFPTIANFFFFCAGSLANVFFVVTFGMAFYWFIFFKRQAVVYLVHPTDSQLKDWLGLFGSAFALKFLEVAHLIFLQCMIDVFFIDWERSRGVVSNSAETTKTKEVPVSIWRTYFVANEWNEIQAVRKINKTFQVWASVFFLVVVGFENTATMDPDGSVTKDEADFKAEYSKVYRYAVAVMVFLVIGIIQWIFFTFIYERFFEDKVRQFVDLCSMSNISVFIMSHAQFGYYIHGRSVHGKADTNMREMFELMKKEEEDMCGQRGLLANTEQQTFAMALPRKLRQRYEAVLLPAQLESAAAASRMDQAGKGGRIDGTAMGKQVEAYSTINRFLSAFIDRSLKDVDYVIKDKSFLESIMDTEFDDTYETGVFYNDNGHSFDSVLFYGNEMSLLLLDVLTFVTSDLIFQNYVIAGVITYLLSELVAIARDGGGRKNLTKKTLVDERFLI